MKPHKQTQPDRISQVTAARIMFAHAKAVDKAVSAQTAAWCSRCNGRNERAYNAAEAAFEALVAGMTRDETE